MLAEFDLIFFARIHMTEPKCSINFFTCFCSLKNTATWVDSSIIKLVGLTEYFTSRPGPHNKPLNLFGPQKFEGLFSIGLLRLQDWNEHEIGANEEERKWWYSVNRHYWRTQSTTTFFVFVSSLIELKLVFLHRWLVSRQPLCSYPALWFQFLLLCYCIEKKHSTLGFEF